ncbi:CRISPR-associated protein [compost metagenome]
MNMLDTNKELVEAIVELNSEEYRRVTVEVLALLNWMRKFATGKHAEWEDEATEGSKKERGNS